jgi:radical SAM protein with 4Fe4S-binding SPASM domain
MDLLSYSCRRRRSHVITNATIMLEGVPEKLVELAPHTPLGKGLVFLGISIHGMEENHDRMVVLEGAFQKAVETVRRVSDYKKKTGKRFPLIHCTMVITNENAEEIGWFVEKVAEWGGDIANFTIHNTGLDMENYRQRDIDELNVVTPGVTRISPRRLSEQEKQVSEIQTRTGIQVRWPDMSMDKLQEHYQGSFCIEDFTCDALWYEMTVNYHGDVLSCPYVPVGNVREETLMECWNKAKMKQIRQHISRDGLWKMCAGCCYLVQKHETQKGRESLESADPQEIVENQS